jgi:hypothetical protein
MGAPGEDCDDYELRITDFDVNSVFVIRNP